MASIRPKDLPSTSSVAVGDRLLLDGATARSIDIDDFVENKLEPLFAPASAVPSVTPYQFGGVGDGTTNDTAAVQDAINAQSAFGGGAVDVSGGKWLIDSADLTIPQGVSLIGPNAAFGRTGLSASTNWANIPGSIILNSSRTIKYTGRGAQMYGVVVVRKGLTAPSTIREAYDAIAAFSGTAVSFATLATAGNANDAYLGYCFIIGFAQAVYSPWNARSRIEYIYGDCTAGIKLSNSLDMQHLVGCHFYPFLTAHITPTSYNVTGAANNGSGLVRLTVSSTATMATGDVANVLSVGGTTEANGRQTITVVDGTHIDIQGSTFVNAYTSGGTVLMNPYRRTGAAYWYDGATGAVDWGQALECFSYGYDNGFKIVSSDYTTFINCGADNYAAANDTTPVGWEFSGTCKAIALSGCKGAAQGKNYRFASSAATEQSISLTNCRSWGAQQYLYSCEDGNVSLIGCTGQTGGVFRVETGAEAVSIIGGDFTGVTFSLATGAVIPSHQFVAGLTPHSRIVDNTNAASVPARSIENHRTTPATNDTIFESAYTTDSAGSQVEISRTSHRASSVTAGAVTALMYWGLRNAGTLTDYLVLTNARLGPITNDLLALGSAGVGWSGAFFASGGVINWANGDVTITHSTNLLAFAGASGGYSFDAQVQAPTYLATEQSASPSTPASTKQALWVDASGRMWTKLSSGRVAMISAGETAKKWTFDAVNNSTSVTTVGTGSSDDGTATAILTASTNYFTRQDRVESLSAASTGANIGRRSTQNYYMSEAGFAYFRFGIEAFQSNMAMFVGIRPSGSHGNVDPSSFTNIVGIGIDSGQTTFRLLNNDGSGTATAVDLGANFPANTSATDFYELMIWWDAGAAVVNYQLVRLNTGDIAAGQLSSNLPSQTQILSAQVIGNTRTGSAAIGISWSRVAGHHG